MFERTLAKFSNIALRFQHISRSLAKVEIESPHPPANEFAAGRRSAGRPAGRPPAGTQLRFVRVGGLPALASQPRIHSLAGVDSQFLLWQEI